MSISSIDELLSGANIAPKAAPIDEDLPDTPEEIEEIEPSEVDEVDNDDIEEGEDDGLEDKPERVEKEPDTDDYGNEKEPENEVIRERLARQARKHEAELNALRAQLAQQNAPENVQQAAKDFEYDPNAQGDWQQQLASFVKQTVNAMTREQSEAQQRQQEQQVHREFEAKFREGMSNFGDFVEVIDALPCQISDAMTIATRGMDNPAAFLYAAAKRQPQELERIAKIRDPYVQITEMGKLEERMRKNKPTTKAPRPLERTLDNASTPKPKKDKESNGDDLLARADAKRLAQVKQRAKGNR